VGREPLSGDQHALFNRASLSTQQQWLVKAIAIQDEQDPNVLRDGKLVYKISQEYANAGVEQLFKLHMQPNDTFSELSTEIIQNGDQLQAIIEK